MVSIVGVVLNVLLFAGKSIAGALTGSISMVADAVNNLSDALSQVISFISFKISAKPADRAHPFGHARIEYVASMIVSIAIIIIGYELFSESVAKIINPEKISFSIISVVILAVSILVKLWLFLFNRKIAKRIDSSVMKATSLDSLADAGATSAVLVSVIISKVLGVNLDAYMGVIVAILIFVAGAKILNETKNAILGEAPSEETVQKIKSLVMSYPEAVGIHDLTVHNYGPGCTMATLHVEVDGSKDIFLAHDAMDNIEKALWNEYSIRATVHLDPIVTDDEEVNILRTKVTDYVRELNEEFHIHDFRFVRGTTHSNLIFDVAVPFEDKRNDSEIEDAICQKIKEIDASYCAVVTIDRQ
jgi:cation diffusion facilitator family transporter